MRLNVNTSDANVTPVLRKWGIGTRSIIKSPSGLVEDSLVSDLNGNLRLVGGAGPVDFLSNPGFEKDLSGWSFDYIQSLVL